MSPETWHASILDISNMKTKVDYQTKIEKVKLYNNQLKSILFSIFYNGWW